MISKTPNAEGFNFEVVFSDSQYTGTVPGDRRVRLFSVFALHADLRLLICYGVTTLWAVMKDKDGNEYAKIVAMDTLWQGMVDSGITTESSAETAAALRMAGPIMAGEAQDRHFGQIAMNPRWNKAERWRIDNTWRRMRPGSWDY